MSKASKWGVKVNFSHSRPWGAQKKSYSIYSFTILSWKSCLWRWVCWWHGWAVAEDVMNKELVCQKSKPRLSNVGKTWSPGPLCRFNTRLQRRVWHLLANNNPTTHILWSMFERVFNPYLQSYINDKHIYSCMFGGFWSTWYYIYIYICIFIIVMTFIYLSTFIYIYMFQVPIDFCLTLLAPPNMPGPVAARAHHSQRLCDLRRRAVFGSSVRRCWDRDVGDVSPSNPNKT